VVSGRNSMGLVLREMGNRNAAQLVKGIGELAKSKSSLFSVARAVVRAEFLSCRRNMCVLPFLGGFW